MIDSSGEYIEYSKEIMYKEYDRLSESFIRKENWPYNRKPSVQMEWEEGDWL